MTKYRIMSRAQIVEQRHRDHLITQSEHATRVHEHITQLDPSDVLRRAGINYGYIERWAFSFAISQCYDQDWAWRTRSRAFSYDEPLE